MLEFVSSQPINGFPHYRTEHILLPLPNTREDFVRAAATFFVKSWLSSLPKMQDIWKNWETSSQEERQAYRDNFIHLYKNGTIIDNPPEIEGETGPMGTFSETMLRWFRKHAQPLLIEPDVPFPTALGDIDLVEITGESGDYASLQLTMWEVKSSDSQISSHTNKIYKQLDIYHKKFYSMANNIANRCAKEPDLLKDKSLSEFVTEINQLVKRRDPRIHYGVFVTYNPNIRQTGRFVSDLHEHPPGCPQGIHHLNLLLIPDFRQLRMDVWQCLHLV